MNNFLYTILGLTLIASTNVNGMQTKECKLLRSYRDASLHDVKLSIALAHDFESYQNVISKKMDQNDIKGMISCQKYTYCLRDKTNIEEYVEATLPSIFNETMRLIDILPNNVNEEIKYRILFFLARTGLHKYTDNAKHFKKHKLSQHVSSGLEYLASLILNNSKISDMYELEHKMADITKKIYKKNGTNEIQRLPSNSQQPLDHAKIFSYAGTYEKKFLQNIYAMYGINPITLNEISKYDLLQDYDTLKRSIEEDISTVANIINNIYVKVKNAINFSVHKINLQNVDKDSVFITGAIRPSNERTENLTQNQQLANLDLPDIEQRAEVQQQNQFINNYQINLFNIYSTPNGSDIKFSQLYKLDLVNAYSMPVFYYNQYQFISYLMPNMIKLTETDYLLANCAPINDSIHFLCQDRLINDPQARLNDFVNVNDKFENLTLYSISSTVNFNGNTVSITPTLTRNAANELILINYISDGNGKVTYIFS